jgi:hypothetical protein
MFMRLPARLRIVSNAFPFNIFVFCFVLSAHAQNYTPASPDAMGLARYANTPVSHYTGTVAINIPLTTIGGNEIAVPVGLSYNASGIKVADIAGSVGLGWSLQAGGMISRVVRGEPDDLTNGFCTPNRSDQEPDMYYYSFGGQSGKFVLDRNGNPILIPYQPIIIKPGICPARNNGMWEIIDANGIIYRFGVSVWERETTTVRQWNGTANPAYVSSWLLSQIRSPNQTEIIQFTYTGASYQTLNHFYTKRKDPCNNDVVQDLTTTITTTTRHIQSISGPQGTVTFSYGNDRRDLTGSIYLTSLEVRNKQQELIAKNRFEYSYFQADGCSMAECLRLRLDKIYDLAPDPAYTFGYNLSVNLPSRYSRNFDHWGYYNNNTVNTWFPIVNNGTGANRTADPARTQANILQSITERTGASRSFIFENHIVNFAPVGGLRIKTVTVNDGLGNNQTITYDYHDSGRISGYPVYGIGSDLFTNSAHELFGMNPNSSYYFLFSHSYKELFDTNGISVGYHSVSETINLLGSVTYYFTTDPDEMVSGAKVDNSWKRGLLTGRVTSSTTSPQLSEATVYNFNRPLKASITWESKLTWNCSDVRFDRSLTTKHTFTSRTLAPHASFTTVFQPDELHKSLQIQKQYSFDGSSGSEFPSEEVSSHTYLPGNGEYIQRVKYPTHHDFYAHVSNDCSDQLTSCLNLCESEPDPQVQGACITGCHATYDGCWFAPPPADPAAIAIYGLRNRHQIAVPIETVSLMKVGTDIKVIAARVNLFETVGDKIFLKATYAMNETMDEANYVTARVLSTGHFEMDSRMRKVKSYDSYNPSSGRLLQETSFSGIRTNYTWDANNNHVIGSTLTAVQSPGVNTPSSLRSGSSTHKTMVGVLSSTDPNGRKTHQEYDAYNRPLLLKDHDGNILARRRYHYKNETPGFRIVTLPNRLEGILNESFSFTATDVFASVGGAPRLVWDLGGGTVVDNNSTSVSRTFSTAGLHTIKLSALHPEYGATTRTVQITIRPAMSGANCVNGAIVEDICGVQEPVYSHCPPGTGAPAPGSPVVITAEISGGCSSGYTYTWRYRNQSTSPPGPWIDLNVSTATLEFYPPPFEGAYEVECNVTDACGNVFATHSYVTRINSSNCEF